MNKERADADSIELPEGVVLCFTKPFVHLDRLFRVLLAAERARVEKQLICTVVPRSCPEQVHFEFQF